MAVVEREGLTIDRDVDVRGRRLGQHDADITGFTGRPCGLVAHVILGGRLDRIGGREGRVERLVALAAALRTAHTEQIGKRPAEGVLRRVESDTVLRALRTRERRHHGAKVELDDLGEGRVLAGLVVPEALLLGVGLNDRHLLAAAAREREVAQRLGVDREDRAGGAELRAHVAERRAVSERQAADARTEELDELADDADLAQALGDSQHEVGRGRTLGQLAGELHADHLRDQHRHRLTEHRGLGLDAAYAPAEHTEAVDHRGVRVGADERVRVEQRRLAVAVLGEDGAREVLEVDLVHNAGLRRHDLEGLKGCLAPLEELVALLVALVLLLGVHRERVLVAELVYLHRVVDHELRRYERLNLGRVTAER